MRENVGIEREVQYVQSSVTSKSNK